MDQDTEAQLLSDRLGCSRGQRAGQEIRWGPGWRCVAWPRHPRELEISCHHYSSLLPLDVGEGASAQGSDGKRSLPFFKVATTGSVGLTPGSPLTHAEPWTTYLTCLGFCFLLSQWG